MRFGYSKRKIAQLNANSRDLDQTPRSAASDLGLHFLSITLLVCPDYNGLIYIFHMFTFSVGNNGIIGNYFFFVMAS